jgi:hypothetical protein
MARSPARPASPGAPRNRVGVEWLALAVVWSAHAGLAWRFWFVTDDAYISFRYARNLARGHGLRFNLGPEAPVEGYSNFLWTLYCAGIEALGGNPELWAPLASFLCGAVLLALVLRVLRERFELALPVAFLTTLGLALFPPFAVWATGGLETMPFALLLFVSFERLVLRRAGVAPVAAAVAGVGLALLRFEGLAWAVLFGALAAVARRCSSQAWLKPIATYFAILLPLYGAYYAWRFAYYGLPLPNTAYAKLGFGAAALEQGFGYLAVYILTFLTPLAVLCAVPAAWSARWRVPGSMTAAAALGTLAYPVLVGGDFMAMGRFFVQGLAFQALTCGLLLQRLWQAGGVVRAASAAAAAALAALGLLPAWNVHLVPASVRAPFHFRHNRNEPLSEYEQWRYMCGTTRHGKAKGLALKEHAKPGDSAVAVAIGSFGYFSELYLHDRVGLVSHEVAVRDDPDARKRSPGHTKGVHSSFFLERRPTYMRVQLLQASAQVLSTARAWRKTSRRLLEDRYVADFRGIPGDAPQPPQVLLVLRELEGSSDPEHAWEQLFARIEAQPWAELALAPDADDAFDADAEQ